MSQNTSILKMDSAKARDFLLKNESYCTLDLPPYFNFSALIDKINSILEATPLLLSKPYPSNFDDVNYTFYSNKDGRYAWRPIQLTHPVLYVDLVHTLTEQTNWNTIIKHFEKCSKNEKIQCISVPSMSASKKSDKAETILNWWSGFEQKSISLSLDYNYLFHTDITDCYGSIYTHSIAWALHSKKTAKKKRVDCNLLGNIIDRTLQNMSNGQTNGIPQGSVLVDFIAEILLAYTDRILSAKLCRNKLTSYHILRYRDDYRIFVNNPQDGEKILKYLTEILIEIGLKISPQKTKISADIISGSVKSDKLYWMRQNLVTQPPDALKNIPAEKQLLIIYQLAREYPNSGSLSKALNNFYDYITELKKNNKLPRRVLTLISIIVHIALSSPKIYPYSAAILSLLLESDKAQKSVVMDKIFRKFLDIPNTGHLLIWLQRLDANFIGPQTKAMQSNMDFLKQEKLCRLFSGESVALWNNKWLNNKTLEGFMANTQCLIDRKEAAKLPDYITRKEVDTFQDYDYRDIITVDIF